jgi:putative acetyltransferase
MLQIREDDLSSQEVRQLIRLHLSGMQENSPAGSVFALDLTGLQSADVTMFSAWNNGELVGIGALKALGDSAGEIKSMRTAPGHLRTGIGAAILEHILTISRQRGYRRVSLETGSGDSFAAALRLYRKRGFKNGPRFGDYIASDFNQFLHLDLGSGPINRMSRGGHSGR